MCFKRTQWPLREALEENNTGMSAQLISQWLKPTDLHDKFKSFQLKRRCYLWASGDSYIAMIAGEGVIERVPTPYQMFWDMSQLLWLVFSPFLPKPVSYVSSQGWNDSSGLRYAHLYSSHGAIVKKQVWQQWILLQKFVWCVCFKWGRARVSI